MIDRDKVTELLKNYRSYRYAVNNGIAPYVEDDTLGMPMVMDYGSRPPRSLSGAGNTIQSAIDYKLYSRAVKMVEGAVSDVLDDDEQNVIRYKYLERNVLTLSQIADKFHMSERRAIYLHKKALKALSRALTFVEKPEIINLDQVLKVSV